MDGDASCILGSEGDCGEGDGRLRFVVLLMMSRGRGGGRRGGGGGRGGGEEDAAACEKGQCFCTFSETWRGTRW